MMYIYLATTLLSFLHSVSLLIIMRGVCDLLRSLVLYQCSVYVYNFLSIQFLSLFGVYSYNNGGLSPVSVYIYNNLHCKNE